MYLEELAPRNDYSKFLPGFLLDKKYTSDDIYRVFPSLLINERIYDNIKWELIHGLAEYHDIINNKQDGKDVRHFTVDTVNDVRIIFRKNSDDGKDRIIGKKMRLYFTGKSGDDAEIEKADSGWLYNLNSSRYVFQTILAKTHLYNALYAIGYRALIGILNGNLEDASTRGKDDDNSTATQPQHSYIPQNYRTLATMSATYRHFDVAKQINHILVPAGWAADVDDPVAFYGRDILDGLMDIILNAKNMDDVRDGFAKLDFSDEEIDEIIAASNNPRAALADEPDTKAGKAQGLNIVTTLDAIANILDSGE